MYPNARILRAVITTFLFTILSLPGNHNNQLVWLYGGNIGYLSGKHIPLFTVGLLFTVLFLIPYTLMVCFIQHLQRHSSFRVLHWVQRLKPLLDAYTGPYKDKYRFWTGLLLLVRAVLFLAIAVNALGDPSLNLLFVILTGNCPKDGDFSLGKSVGLRFPKCHLFRPPVHCIIIKLPSLLLTYHVHPHRVLAASWYAL